MNAVNTRSLRAVGFASPWERIDLPEMISKAQKIDALNGAVVEIKNNHPVLAISAYHRQEHLREVPLLAHALCQDYRMHLRRTAECSSTIWCYMPFRRIAARALTYELGVTRDSLAK